MFHICETILVLQVFQECLETLHAARNKNHSSLSDTEAAGHGFKTPTCPGIMCEMWKMIFSTINNTDGTQQPQEDEIRL